MNLMPWDYYNADGSPKPEIAKAIAALEGVMKRWPSHTGANHLYIHAVEASSPPRPRRRQCRQARTPRSRRRTPRPHARAHLHARRPLQRRRPRSTSRPSSPTKITSRSATRRAYYPVAYYPHNIHFLTYAIHDGRPQQGRHRERAQAPLQAAARHERRSAVGQFVYVRALLRARAFRPVGRHSCRA